MRRDSTVSFPKTLSPLRFGATSSASPWAQPEEKTNAEAERIRRIKAARGDGVRAALRKQDRSLSFCRVSPGYLANGAGDWDGWNEAVDVLAAPRPVSVKPVAGANVVLGPKTRTGTLGPGVKLVLRGPRRVDVRLHSDTSKAIKKHRSEMRWAVMVGRMNMIEEEEEVEDLELLGSELDALTLLDQVQVEGHGFLPADGPGSERIDEPRPVRNAYLAGLSFFEEAAASVADSSAQARRENKPTERPAPTDWSTFSFFDEAVKEVNSRFSKTTFGATRSGEGKGKGVEREPEVVTVKRDKGPIQLPSWLNPAWKWDGVTGTELFPWF